MEQDKHILLAKELTVVAALPVTLAAMEYCAIGCAALDSIKILILPVIFH
jgi:hypothetical protein